MSVTPIAHEGSGRGRGQGEPGSWGHGDTVLSCKGPHDARLTQGTEPGGPGTAPASPVAAEGFGRGLCFGHFHLKIKEQEKCFISSFGFLQSRLFFLPSSSPSPLFVAHKQAPSVELSLRFWPRSSLPWAPLLFMLEHNSPADSGAFAGCSEAAFPASLEVQGLG